MKRQWQEKPRWNIRERKNAVRSAERKRKERPREATLGKAEKGKNPERIEEKCRKGETQSEVRNDRDRKGQERIEEKEWERRNPERIEGMGEKGEPPEMREERTGKGETRREVRNSRGRRNPERK